MLELKHFSRKYLREETLPTAFCPGCFNGILMNAMFKAFEELGIHDLRKYVFISGIGCAAWIPSPYIKADSIHTLHGRAIAVATGVKLARPDLEVIVFGGDGDISAIGGNHLIHAARRNMDLIVVMVNNLLYAMTGGQQSPTTPLGLKTPTTPHGNPEMPFDISSIIVKTNANYVARWCISNFAMLKNSFKEVLTEVTQGFRFIEVWAPCTTYVIRYEGITPGEKLKIMNKICIPLSKYSEISDDWKIKYVPVGVFKKELKPGFLELIKQHIDQSDQYKVP
jgi:2-oxoglutarate ferredoxin oxidoreductase subunit beta